MIETSQFEATIAVLRSRVEEGFAPLSSQWKGVKTSNCTLIWMYFCLGGAWSVSDPAVSANFCFTVQVNWYVVTTAIIFAPYQFTSIINGMSLMGFGSRCTEKQGSSLKDYTFF